MPCLPLDYWELCSTNVTSSLCRITYAEIVPANNRGQPRFKRVYRPRHSNRWATKVVRASPALLCAIRLFASSGCRRHTLKSLGLNLLHDQFEPVLGGGETATTMRWQREAYECLGNRGRFNQSRHFASQTVAIIQNARTLINILYSKLKSADFESLQYKIS